MLRLQSVEKPLANFFASGIFRLREKLGPILWQFPPNFSFEADQLANFFALLPRNLTEAAALACKREAFMRGKTVLSIDANRPLRYAMEVRHESFRDPRFVRLLRKYRIALVVAETAGRWPMLQDVTANFMYLRLHGDKKLYRSGYSPAALARWAGRITAWSGGSEPPDALKVEARTTPDRRPRDVYCYFDNTDEKLRAPVDAKALMRNLGVPCTPGGFESQAGSRNAVAPGGPGASKASSRLVRHRSCDFPAVGPETGPGTKPPNRALPRRR
jgi:uncharacterized protein YecE (DUF72 family)